MMREKGEEKSQKRRGPATLRCNTRREFCADRGADGCTTRATRSRVSCTYLGSHRARTGGVHWSARSQSEIVLGWRKYYFVVSYRRFGFQKTVISGNNLTYGAQNTSCKPYVNHM